MCFSHQKTVSHSLPWKTHPFSHTFHWRLRVLGHGVFEDSLPWSKWVKGSRRKGRRVDCVKRHDAVRLRRHCGLHHVAACRGQWRCRPFWDKSRRADSRLDRSCPGVLQVSRHLTSVCFLCFLRLKLLASPLNRLMLPLSVGVPSALQGVPLNICRLTAGQKIWQTQG